MIAKQLIIYKNLLTEKRNELKGALLRHGDSIRNGGDPSADSIDHSAQARMVVGEKVQQIWLAVRRYPRAVRTMRLEAAPASPPRKVLRVCIGKCPPLQYGISVAGISPGLRSGSGLDPLTPAWVNR